MSCAKRGEESSEITLLRCWMKAKCKALKEKGAYKLKHKAEEKNYSLWSLHFLRSSHSLLHKVERLPF